MLMRWRSKEVWNWIKYLTDNLIEMAKIQIKQVRSKIGRPERQKRTLAALGLKKINHMVEHEATPQIMGMVDRVKHLVEIKQS